MFGGHFSTYPCYLILNRNHKPALLGLRGQRLLECVPHMDLAVVNMGSEVGTKLNSGTAPSTARGHQVSTLLAGSAIPTPRPSQVKCLSLKTKRSLGPAQPICLHAAAQMRRWTTFQDNIHEEKLLVNPDVERLTIHSSLWSYLLSGLVFKGKI